MERSVRIARYMAVVVVTASLLGQGRVAADEDDLGARWHAVREGAVERLHALANWCTNAKLFGARADVYETLLRFDPDDTLARKRLRYRRSPEGTWVRSPGYVRPKNRSRSLPAYEKQREAWKAWFVGEARSRAQAAGAAGDTTERTRILHFAIDLVPDDPDLRHMNGEVRQEGPAGARWILVETETSLRRRTALKKAVREALDAVPEPRPGMPTEEDGYGDVAWRPVLQGRYVRVLGVPAPEEMRTQFDYCEATWPVFEAVFDLEVPSWDTNERYVSGLTVYVLPSGSAGNEFLRHQPGIAEDEVAFLLPLVVAWIPGRPAIVVKHTLLETRLEAGPKAILAAMCRWMLGITVERAWAAEGLAHYLTHLITGTHCIACVQKETGHTTPRPDLTDTGESSTPGGDEWLAIGRDLLAGETRPDIRLLAGKNVNTITHDEVLYAYCIVAYLIEGRPDACVAFFQDVARPEHTDLETIVRKHLGFDVATLETHVLRWLEETTAPPP